MFEPITTIRSRGCLLDAADIDTDRVIPARFLTTTVRSGLGEHLFEDWRAEELKVRTALTGARRQGAAVLVTGPNFGCGSSREHAVWSLVDFGFRAIVAPSFADIFHANAIGNGLVPVRVAPSDMPGVHAATERGCEFVVDVLHQELRGPDGACWSFSLPPFEHTCLTKGWDALDFLVAQEKSIAEFERARAQVGSA